MTALHGSQHSKTDLHGFKQALSLILKCASTTFSFQYNKSLTLHYILQNVIMVYYQLHALMEGKTLEVKGQIIQISDVTGRG
jgi:hypothetical protein